MNICKNTSSEKQNPIHERSFCGMVLRAQIKAPICTFSEVAVLASQISSELTLKHASSLERSSLIASCHYSTCALSAAPRIAGRCGRRRRCTVALVHLPVLTGLLYNVTRKRVVPHASLVSGQVENGAARLPRLYVALLACTNMALGQGRLEVRRTALSSNIERNWNLLSLSSHISASGFLFAAGSEYNRNP